ncbi:hypothetical protein ACIHCV_45590 [Streptomyces sp. NPDC051956]|uniref:hypothetical protein n=1 Tax=Streptomyces sp. NPDC051956 TaxID=3365677 RepID=UPI0037D1E40D
MERHVLMRLLAGDDEASAAALAALPGGATYVVWDRTVPAERHAGVYARRLRRVRLKGIEPLGLGAGERAIDGVDSFAGLALRAAVGTYVDGRTADGRFERD